MPQSSVSRVSVAQLSAAPQSSNTPSNTNRALLVAAGVAAVSLFAAFVYRRRKKQPFLPSPLSLTSSTAQATALMRFLHPPWRTPGAVTRGANGEVFGQDLYSEAFLSEEQRVKLSDPQTHEAVRKLLVTNMPGLCNWLWCRTRCIDSEVYRLVTSGSPAVEQLVILGAGYDTRSYRFATALDLANIRRFEVDLPTLQQAKRASVEALAQRQPVTFRAALDKVVFVPLDLSRPKNELLSGMQAAGFDSTRVSLYIWEGVTAYLTADACRQSLQFMSEGCASGSSLLVTFLTPSNVREQAHHVQAIREQQMKREPHIYHPTVDEFTEVLELAGWTIERLYTPDTLFDQFGTPDEGKEWPGAHVALARRR